MAAPWACVTSWPWNEQVASVALCEDGAQGAPGKLPSKAGENIP